MVCLLAMSSLLAYKTQEVTTPFIEYIITQPTLLCLILSLALNWSLYFFKFFFTSFNCSLERRDGGRGRHTRPRPAAAPPPSW